MAALITSGFEIPNNITERICTGTAFRTETAEIWNGNELGTDFCSESGDRRRRRTEISDSDHICTEDC